MELTDNIPIISKEWVDRFASACSAGNAQAFVDLFLPTGWLRDNLVFSWNHRSLGGHAAIFDYLVDRLHKRIIFNVNLDEKCGILPSYNPSTNILEAAFVFDVDFAYGRGLMLLRRQDARWQALSIYMTLTDLKGHEEKGPDLRQRSLSFITENEDWKRSVETDPHVLIAGAGQSGLQIGARFKQMDIPVLLIEKAESVGDQWRDRYPSLTLHTPNTQHALLYTRPASNSAKYSPRDKIAAMLEQYAYNQDLVIWTRSTMLPMPIYDKEERKWTVHVNHNGVMKTLRPAHIILAVGFFGRQSMPSLPRRDEFLGEVFHASDFKGPQAYTGKKVVVVGASQTAADICQDLASHGVECVTMIQRSNTAVVSLDYVSKTQLDFLWPPNGDPLLGDFRGIAMPISLLKQLLILSKKEREAYHKDMYVGLEKAGFRLNEGPDGAGQGILLFQRGGGYWIDVGAAELIIQGKIKVKSGIEPTHFDPQGLVFSDGSLLEADSIIFATGYKPVQDIATELFGEGIARRITPVWGLTEEGEIRRTCTPSGHPGLWWGMGDFSYTRYYSKSLAIQIKARQLGLVDESDA
ncbi:hypothetical protein M422DRAFT_249627 [Sphaerobolus stellatus SS14]|uniref:Uncharacterized protein n=1 Tax=Sphaerobolus stellatus (strain SS14) TaxID=990650 RepID=A0A0C9W555_SPHS4|nr:hypothetical protein M422DRAFT_249627 [Sphaerobolus stellatus SS14]